MECAFGHRCILFSQPRGSTRRKVATGSSWVDHMQPGTLGLAGTEENHHGRRWRRQPSLPTFATDFIRQLLPRKYQQRR